MAGAEVLGGEQGPAPNHLTVDGLLLDARKGLENTLGEYAAQLPAAAVAPWADVASAVPYALTPPPVRIGTEVTSGQPVVLPVAGKIYCFGDPELLKISSVPYADMTGKSKLVKTWLAQKAVARAQDDEVGRFSRLDRESLEAAVFAKAVITRTLAATLPGMVDVTICTPPTLKRLVQSFTEFDPLRKQGFRQIPTSQLATLLNVIHNNVSQRKLSDQTEQYPSHVVVIFGSGMPFAASDKVSNLLYEASKFGFSFILHGMELPYCGAELVAVDSSSHVTIPGLNIQVQFDGEPPASVISTVAKTTAMIAGGRKQGEQYSSRPVVWNENAYRSKVNSQAQRVTALERATKGYAQRFPWLNRQFVDADLPAAVSQYDINIDLARSGQLPFANRIKDLNQPGERLAASAALALSNSYFGPNKPLHASSLPGTLLKEIEAYLPAMASILSPLQACDRSGKQVDAALREHTTELAQALSYEATCWAFQLVADRAAKAHWQTKEGPNRPFVHWSIIDAVATRLQAVYGYTLARDAEGGIAPEDQALATCLAACHFLDASHFSNADPDWQITLARYAGLAVRGCGRTLLEQKAPDALLAYDTCMDVLKRAELRLTSAERFEAGRDRVLALGLSAGKDIVSLSGRALRSLTGKDDQSS